MRRTHPTDDRLLELSIETPSDAEAAHLTLCHTCQVRRTQIDGFLQNLTETGTSEVDEIFPASRLATQRDRILQRIAHECRAARVLAFPVAGTELRAFKVRPPSRWVAVAAAAGLAIGLVVGRLSNGYSRRVTQTTIAQDAGPSFMGTALAISDDEFMGEIELAAAGPLPVLLPLHTLTPMVLSDEFSATVP